MRTPVSRFEKVAGYFILFTLSLLAVLIVAPGTKHGGFLNQTLFKLHVLADDGMDLAAGDKVMMQGIQIGEIDAMELVSNKVMITCSIYRKYRKRITRDSKVFVVPAAIVGRGKVDIQPGTRSPVLSGYVMEAHPKTSMTGRVDDLLVQVGQLIGKADNRIAEFKTTLESLQQILQQVNEGKGSLGKFVYEEEIYNRTSNVLVHMEEAIGIIGRLRDPIVEFSKALPIVTRALLRFNDQIGDVITKLQEGMNDFPRVVSTAVVALMETRKVLESLKRSFFIRGNLPRDSDPPGMASASRRVPPTDE